MLESSLIQWEGADLYSIRCVERVRMGGGGRMRMDFVTGCRFQTVGQRLFVGFLDTRGGWNDECRRGFGVTIDTEDGTVTDMINGLGVIDYVDGAPLRAGETFELGFEVEGNLRAWIPRIRVGGETVLHPALSLEEVTEMGACVGTTLLWGGSASFVGGRLRCGEQSSPALAS